MSEQDDEVARIFDRFVHGFNEARPKRDVVVLHQDLVAVFREHIGNLTRDARYGAATADKEIAAFAALDGHILRGKPALGVTRQYR